MFYPQINFKRNLKCTSALNVIFGAYETVLDFDLKMRRKNVNIQLETTLTPEDKDVNNCHTCL